MKVKYDNIILLLLLLLPVLGSSQVDIEIVPKKGERTYLRNESAKVLLEVTNDSLLITSNDLTAHYKISKIQVQGTDNSSKIYTIFIDKGREDLISVIINAEHSTITFRYKGGKEVINKGAGITYQIPY